MNNQWHLKACPRCGGDLHQDSDEYGEYKSCLQCGYNKPLTGVGDLQEGRGSCGDCGKAIHNGAFCDQCQGRGRHRQPQIPGSGKGDRRATAGGYRPERG